MARLRTELTQLRRLVGNPDECPHCRNRWTDMVTVMPGEPKPEPKGCPVCGQYHRQVLWIVPPDVLDTPPPTPQPEPKPDPTPDPEPTPQRRPRRLQWP